MLYGTLYWKFHSERFTEKGKLIHTPALDNVTKVEIVQEEIKLNGKVLEDKVLYLK